MSEETKQDQASGGDAAAKAQPSGMKGDNPATAGSGKTEVTSAVPERTEGQINPSSPGNVGTTPGTNAKNG